MQGEVFVRVDGGAWATEAIGVPGANGLNFFVDLPEQAARNDVTLPAGRLFFSGAVWDSRKSLPPGILDGVVGMPNGEPVGVVEGPGGVFMLNRGELSVRSNSARNLWGLFGEGSAVMGQFTLASALPSRARSAISPLASQSAAAVAVGPANAVAEAVPSSTVLDLPRPSSTIEESEALARELVAKRARLEEVERREAALLKMMAEIDAKHAWLARLGGPSWGQWSVPVTAPPEAARIQTAPLQTAPQMAPLQTASEETRDPAPDAPSVSAGDAAISALSEACGSGDENACDELAGLRVELAATKARLAELERREAALLQASDARP